MADHILETRMWLPRPRVEVFALLADPTCLPRIAPPWLGVRLLAAPPVMTAWAVLEYRGSWLGLPLRWRLFVREWDPPVRFVAVQVRGPFARWEHRHILLEEGGGTTLEDRVTYRLPLGPIGVALHAGLVRRQIAAAWEHRRARLAEMLAETGGGRRD
jgi:ligand-binding SRPBCC domain-containing protein